MRSARLLEEKRLQAKIVEVGCIGPCYLEPLLDIQLPGHPRMSHANVTPERARYLVEAYITGDKPPVRMAIGHYGENGSEFTGKIPRFFDLPMLKPQVRVVSAKLRFRRSRRYRPLSGQRRLYPDC